MTDRSPSLDDLLAQIPIMEQESAHDALMIYTPAEKDKTFYHDLCRFYLNGSHTERTRIPKAIIDKQGIINNLLGFIYQCAEQLKETRNKEWLQIGLAAASIRGDGPDFRDFYLALCELFVAALDTGIDPIDDFNAINGGVPKDFHTFPVLKARLARIK